MIFKNVGAGLCAVNGEFIKPIGDGLLIFFADEEKSLEFACHLRDLSRYRQLDLGDFFADLRMVAHMGKFSFDFFRHKIKDLNGPGGITVFRMEKYAHQHDVVITGTALEFLDDLLKQKNINAIHLGRKKLKGFDKETDLYKLIFHDNDEKTTHGLLQSQMENLEKETKRIPVFGELYPPISMAENFINLEVKKTDHRVGNCYSDWNRVTGEETIAMADGRMEVAVPGCPRFPGPHSPCSKCVFVIYSLLDRMLKTLEPKGIKDAITD